MENITIKNKCLNLGLSLLIFLIGCGPSGNNGEGLLGENGSGGPIIGTRIQGSLPGIVVENRSITGKNVERSLISQVASISVLLTHAGELDEEATVTAEVNDDGEFLVDLEPEPDAEYVILVHSDEEGVGVEQSLGFIEIPAAGDESSAGWPLGNTGDGDVLDLGNLDGTSGVFLPDGVESDGIYDILGIERGSILLQAQRDNYLKFVQNRYLNKNPQVEIMIWSYNGGFLEEAFNRWLDPEDVIGMERYQFGVGIHFDAEEELVNGTHTLIIKPPDNVHEYLYGDYGPDNPIGESGEWETTMGFLFQGPPPEGIWEVYFDGELDGTYDIAISNPYDSGGHYLYPIESFKFNVDENTSEILGLELRYLIWDPGVAAYIDFDPGELGLINGEINFEFSIVGEPDNVITRFLIPTITGVVHEFPETVYWNGPLGSLSLGGVYIGYVLGVLYERVIVFGLDNLF
jgi:hypothetical protein